MDEFEGIREREERGRGWERRGKGREGRGGEGVDLRVVKLHSPAAALVGASAIATAVHVSPTACW